jgi:hypothetical protein
MRASSHDIFPRAFFVASGKVNRRFDYAPAVFVGRGAF